MPAFLLALVACLVGTFAGREQLRVARLSAVLGAGHGLLAAILVSSVATGALAAWLGVWLAELLSPFAVQVLVTLALLVAALELALLRPGPTPQEPTRSAGAILLVLLAAQATGPAGLLVIVLTLRTGEPVFVAAGGALGSAIALVGAALAGVQWERRIAHRKLALGVAGLLLLIAVLAGLSASGIFA